MSGTATLERKGGSEPASVFGLERKAAVAVKESLAPKSGILDVDLGENLIEILANQLRDAASLEGPAIELHLLPRVGMVAASALIFGAAYTLWMFKRVYLGPVTNDHVKELTDINSREFVMMALLAVAVMYMGIYPKPFTDVMDTSVAELLKHVALSKLN